MRMLSGRMHWLTVGLALLVSAQGFATKRLYGQAPLKPSGATAKRQTISDGEYQAMAGSHRMPPSMAGGPSMAYPMLANSAMGPSGPMAAGGVGPAGGMMMPDAPTSMVLQGPPPMEVAYASATGPGCDYPSGGCGTCGGLGCNMCGGGGGVCGMCGGNGCNMCGGGLMGGNGCFFSGRMLGLLGCLAPYSEGGRGAQRWFDIYAGTIGLSRTSDFGDFQTSDRNIQTGEFGRSNLITREDTTGPFLLRSTDLDLDKMRYGLELVANLQTGPGANLEFRYFGLNNWDVSRSVSRNTPILYSNYSLFGSSPPGGFDDTDESFIQGISYNSELHNGEVNYRRRWVSPFEETQGSWIMGVRHFDLDERFGFAATGSNDNTFTFDQLRFFNHDTITRNQLTGFQIGGDLWFNVAPGIHAGVELKSGIFGNHAEAESLIFSNSIPLAREHLQDGKTAYLTEFTTSLVYRLTYSWSLKASYNLLYVDNVALAPENYNTRDISNAVGLGAFTPSRFPFIDVDGEVLYQGWSLGGEFMF